MDSAHTWRLRCCCINASVDTRSPDSGSSPQVGPLNSSDGADGCSAHGECLVAPASVRTRLQLSALLPPGVDLCAGAGAGPALPPPGRFADWTAGQQLRWRRGGDVCQVNRSRSGWVSSLFLGLLQEACFWDLCLWRRLFRGPLS